MEEPKLPPPEMQICKCCGRELPIENFSRGGYGLLHTCKECQSKKSVASRQKKKSDELDQLRQQLQEARTLRLRDFHPRELMIELKRRGYEGTLTYTEVRTIDITKID